MSSGLSESKRSIHSTRIDVIAGDPVPIQAVDALPINALGKPAVSDPEYKPETVPELAAALSTLARLVPPGHVTDLYLRIRDLIGKIVPIDTTSLDLIKEGAETLLPDDVESAIQTALDSAQRHMLVLREKDPEHYREKGSIIASLTTRLTALATMASKKNKATLTKQEIDKIHKAALRTLDQYTENFPPTDEDLRQDAAGEDRGEAEVASLTGAVAKKIDRADRLAQPDDQNRSQLHQAYARRIGELDAAGDAFDMKVARELRIRLKKIEEAFREAQGTSSETGLTFRKLASIIAAPGGSAAFRVDLIGRAASAGSGATGFDFLLEPIFAPGTTRALLTTGPVMYDTEGRYVESVGHVHVYRRYAQTFDGQQVELQPDIFVDLGNIRSDFILEAAENIAQQGDAENAEALASNFFNANRHDIIAQMLLPDSVYAMTQSRRSKLFARISRQRGLGDKGVKKLSEAQIFTLQLARERVDALLNSPQEPSAMTGESRDRVKRDQDALQTLRSRDFFDAKEAATRQSIRAYLRSAIIGVQPTDSRDDLDDDDLMSMSETASRRAASADSAASGVAKAYFDLRTAAKESCQAISRADMRYLSRRGIKLSNSRAAVTPEEVRSAEQKVAQLATKLNSLIASGDPSDASMIQTVRRALKSIADASIHAVGTASKSFRSESESAIASRRLVELATTIGLGVDKDKAVPFLAELVQLIPNSVNLASLLNAITGQAAKKLQDKAVQLAVSAASDNATARAHSFPPFAANLNPRVVANHTAYFHDVRTAIERALGTDVTAASFDAAQKAFGIKKTGFPLILTNEARAAVNQTDEGKALIAKRGVIAPNLADTLYGIERGSCERLVSQIGGNPKEQLASIEDLSDAIGSSAVRHLKELFLVQSTVSTALLTVVYTACAIQDQSEEQSSAMSAASIVADMVREGIKGTRIDTAAIGTAAFGAYKTAVDLLQPGTGFFVDSSGQPIARVVGAVSHQNASRVEISAGMSFLDNGLAAQFVAARSQVSNEVARKLGVLGSDAASPERNFIQEEVDSFLVEAVRDVAAEINRSFVPARISAQVERDEGGSESFNSHISRLETIAISDKSSNLTKAIAIAAMNRARALNAVTSEDVDYYAPVKQADPADPESGASSVLGRHDFVRQTLSLSDLNPHLPVYTDQLNKADRNSFIDDIWRMTEAHVLTDIIDTHGRKIRRARPDIERKVRSKETGTSGGRERSERIHSPMSNRLAGDIARRDPEMIDGSQVLSLVPRVRPGVSAETLDEARREIRFFLQRLMIEAGDEGGYILPSAPRKIQSEIPSEDVENYFTAAGIAILDSIIEIFMDKSRNAVGELIAIKGETGEDVYLTPEEVRDIAAKKAQQDILSRVAERHYAAVGLPAAVKLHYSKDTGTPLFPTSPRQFFHEKGINDIQKIRDPFRYVLRVRAVEDEYRKMLKEKYNIGREDTDASANLRKIVQNSTNTLPGMLEEAEKVARDEAANLKNTHLLGLETLLGEAPPPLSVDPTTKKVLGLTNVSDVENTSPSNLYNDLQRIIAICAAGRKFRDETFSTLAETEAGRKVNNDTRQAQIILRSMQEQSAAYIAKSDKVVMMRDTSSQQYQIVSNDIPTAVAAYTSIVGLISSHIRSLIAAEANQQVAVAADLIDDALAEIAARKVEEIGTALRQIEAERSAEVRALISQLGGPKNAERIMRQLRDALGMEKKSEVTQRLRDKLRAKGSVEFQSIPRDSVASDTIERLSAEWRKVSQDMQSSREKVQRAVSDVRSDVDDELRRLAARLAPKIEKIVRREVSEDIFMFDTFSQLEAYEAEKREGRRNELLAALKGQDPSDKESQKIDNIVSRYVNHELGGKIFGVRSSETPA
jgi:hypothetical protein